MEIRLLIQEDSGNSYLEDLKIEFNNNSSKDYIHIVTELPHRDIAVKREDFIKMLKVFE